MNTKFPNFRLAVNQHPTEAAGMSHKVFVDDDTANPPPVAMVPRYAGTDLEERQLMFAHLLKAAPTLYRALSEAYAVMLSGATLSITERTAVVVTMRAAICLAEGKEE